MKKDIIIGFLFLVLFIGLFFIDSARSNFSPKVFSQRDYDRINANAPVWLQTVNYYRSLAGPPLSAVTEDSFYNNACEKHSLYCLKKGGPFHEETDKKIKYYSEEGSDAGINSNVLFAYGLHDPKFSILQIVSGPFHFLGMLNPHLERVSYGFAEDLKSKTFASTLDIGHGISSNPVSYPIFWPGNNAKLSSSLVSYNINELPNPAPGKKLPLGLAIIAMFGEGNNPTSIDRSHCEIKENGVSIPFLIEDQFSYKNKNITEQDLARSILHCYNAVYMMIDHPLKSQAKYKIALYNNNVLYNWQFSVE